MVFDALKELNFGRTGNMFLLPGLPKGEDPGPARAHGNVSTVSGHAHAPEIARESRHGPTRANVVPENERRSVRRKDYPL